MLIAAVVQVVFLEWGRGGWIVGKALWSDYKRMQSSELSFSLCNRYELLLHLLYSMK